MMPKVYIDGMRGTTGLLIHERIAAFPGIKMIAAPEDMRKDAVTRSRLLNEADLVVLCLPDHAAREAVSLIRNPAVRILDASSAHRVSSDWVYGLPELGRDHEDLIRNAHKVANPGCFATGAVLILRPLVEAGLVPADYPFSIVGMAGYSAGGRKMIERFEKRSPQPTEIYSGLNHRHLPEIMYFAGLHNPPAFLPTIGAFRRGMVIQVPLSMYAIRKLKSADVVACLKARYQSSEHILVRSRGELEQEGRAIRPDCMAGSMQDVAIWVEDDGEGQIVVGAAYDNLGKGSSGAAVRNLKLMLGLEEKAA